VVTWPFHTFTSNFRKIGQEINKLYSKINKYDLWPYKRQNSEGSITKNNRCLDGLDCPMIHLHTKFEINPSNKAVHEPRVSPDFAVNKTWKILPPKKDFEQLAFWALDAFDPILLQICLHTCTTWHSWKYIAYLCIIMHVKLYVSRSVCTIYMYVPIPKGHYHQVWSKLMADFTNEQFKKT